MMKGLTKLQAYDNYIKFGKNEIKAEKRISILSLYLNQYKSIITFILVLACLFSIYINERLDGIFIFLVLFSNGLFGFFQEYKAEKTLERLKDFTVLNSHVIRDGKEIEIDAKYLVPGDLVVLREGDRIPADGILTSNVPLEVDESIFTGESLPVEKKKEDNVYSGTFILRGRGEMEVLNTGFQTKLGEIVKKISKIKKTKTPLSSNLDNLSKKIAVIALTLSFLLIPIGILQQRDLKDLVLTFVSLSVAMIPEGLPLIVTIALAVGAYRMAKQKALVRKMMAIETLGATNVILTDKTGTLTQNKMSVKKFYLEKEDNLNLLLRACVLGNTATIVEEEGKPGFEAIGDKTDAALAILIKGKVKDFEEFKNQGKVIYEKPFDPTLKTIEVGWEDQGKTNIFVRGAPESIFPLLDKEEKEKVEDKFMSYAKEGLRVIAFSYKEKNNNGFKFLGFIGIYDPPRVEAAKAVHDAKKAGIRVVMVTGDNAETAKSIAEEIGLIEEKELILTSYDLEKLTDEDLSKILPQIRIFARAKPEDKLRLVRLYKRQGYIVSVTGDGVNDALALEDSNIGVAMGQKGTDVAKEAADMVITDDNLYTIIKAVEEGRAIFNNILKTIIYLISTNVAEFLIVLFSILLNLPIALVPTQILWINLIGDGLPGLALASDTNRNGLLNMKPRDTKEQILNKKSISLILKISVGVTFLAMIVYILSLTRFSEKEARLIVFNLIIFVEMIIAVILRGGIRPLNKFLIISIFISLLLQVIININPVLRNIFS